MQDEKREIILKENFESGSYGIGSISVDAEAGKALKVPTDEARLAVGGGYFEYTATDAAPNKEALMKMKKDVLLKQAADAQKSLNPEIEPFDFDKLTKDKIADYIVTPALRDSIIAAGDAPEGATTSAAGGATVSAAQIAGVPNTVTSSTTGDV